MQVDSLVWQKKQQGALPVVHRYLRRLGWPELLRPFLLHSRYMEALDVLVKSVLLKPNALYRIGDWAQGYDPAFGASAYLGDDVLGRALDRLFEADRASLLTTLIVRAVQAFAIDTSQIHNDSTSVKFSGAYEHQNPSALELHRGFSKDHRPDLKQLVYCLSVSADGAVPVHFKAYAGNQTDDPTHLETWQCLCRILGHSDFLYVADSKLCVKATLLRIDQDHGRFITILPCPRREMAQFAQRAMTGRIRWEPLWNRRALRKGTRRELFELARGRYRTEDGFRLYWYRSSEKRRHDAQVRQEQVKKALQRLNRLNERRGRGPKTEPAIRRAAEAVLRRYKVGDWIHFEIQNKTQCVTRQSTRGRPSRITKFWSVTKTIPVLTTSTDTSALARAANLDGTFPLVTNTKLNALAVLKKYKYQPRLEKRHSLAKSVLEISPVFLKKNSRIEALMFVYFTAQLMAALMERSVRENMAQLGLKALPILPEARESKTPSYAQIVEAFAGCEKAELYERGQLIHTFVQPLSKLQQTLLRLLDVEASAYS
jgi:transposase